MAKLPGPTESDEVTFDEPSALDNMDLPDGLERIDGGIRLTGHRISLYLILDAIFDGKSLEEMDCMYPTVTQEEFTAVIRFAEAHPEAMRAYHLEELTIARRLEAEYRSSPFTLDKLRARRAQALASKSQPES